MQQAGCPPQDEFPPALLPALLNLAQAAPDLLRHAHTPISIPSAEQAAEAAYQAALQSTQEAAPSLQLRCIAAGDDPNPEGSSALLSAEPREAGAATGAASSSRREVACTDHAAADTAAAARTRTRANLVWQGLDAQPALPVAWFLGGSDLAQLSEDVQCGHAMHAAGHAPQAPKLPAGAAAYPLLLQLHLEQVLEQQQALAPDGLKQQQQQQQHGPDAVKAVHSQQLLEHAQQMLLAARKGLQEEEAAAEERILDNHRAQPPSQQQPPAPSSRTLSQPAQQLSHLAVRMLQHAAQQLLHAAAAPDSIEAMAAAYAAVDAVTWRLQGPPVMESPHPVQQQQQRRRTQVLNLGLPAGGEGPYSQQVLLARGPSSRPPQQPDSTLSPRGLGLPPRPPSAAAAAADTPRSKHTTDARGTSHAAASVEAGPVAVQAPPAAVAGGATGLDIAQGTPVLQPPSSSRDSQHKGLPPAAAAAGLVAPSAAAGPPAEVTSPTPGCGAPGIVHAEGSWTAPDEAFAGKAVAA